jgi:hypothetical protein
MDRELLLKLWDESWDQGIWIAPWNKAIGDLTPQQSAWKPAPERHSIWQMVNHVCLWREHTLKKIAGVATLSDDEMQRRNFEAPPAVSAGAWDESRRRLKITHDQIRGAIADPSKAFERLPYHLGHDCYHLGQIMYLRAMQGLRPIE